MGKTSLQRSVSVSCVLTTVVEQWIMGFRIQCSAAYEIRSSIMRGCLNTWRPRQNGRQDRRHYRMHILYGIDRIQFRVSLKLFPKGPIDIQCRLWWGMAVRSIWKAVGYHWNYSLYKFLRRYPWNGAFGLWFCKHQLLSSMKMNLNLEQMKTTSTALK